MWFILFFSIVTALLASCSGKKSKIYIAREAKFRSVVWQEIDGWYDDNHLEAIEAFRISCRAISKRKPNDNISHSTELGGKSRHWQQVCHHLAIIEKPSSRVEARRFFEKWFKPFEVHEKSGKDVGRMTGYYEIILRGSRKKFGPYKYPIYKVPKGIKQLKGANCLSRANIERGFLAKQNLEMVWVDDPVRLFFLHIQGSGIIHLVDGGVMKVQYAEQNGFPYVCVLPYLQKYGARGVNSATDMMKWLKANPAPGCKIMEKNSSYVFFSELLGPSPVGGQGVPLTRERSLAIDYGLYPYGMPVWVSTTLPVNAYHGEKQYKRLFIAQDTGGAIKGPIRGDIFFGRGDMAENLAATLNKPGKFYILMPKAVAMPSKYKAAG